MDASGRTPLDRAFDSDHMAIPEMMLRQERADHSESLKGSSPLHRAASLGLTEAVRSLIRCGADAMGRDYQGEIPLHKAVRQGYRDTAAALLDHSDVNTASNEGMTPLHWACLTGDQDMAALLVRHGADRKIRNESLDGLTPRDLAVNMGYAEFVQQLGAQEIFV